MTQNQWKRRVSDHKAAARAGGRRRYNALRWRQMWERRFQILKIYYDHGNLPRGSQKKLAQHFGVDKGVISRDVAWVRSVFKDCIVGEMPRCFIQRGRAIIEWEMSYGG